MKRFSRQTISALLALLTIAALASCGSTDDSGTKTTDAASSDTTIAAVTEDTKPAILDALDDSYDFGGETYTMLVRESRVDAILVEEAIGEVYNDAVFDRNAGIEERFNIEFEMQTLADESSLWNKQISASVMANDGAYDVVMPDYWWGCETGGYFLNLRNYDDILAFDQPWWTHGWNENAEIYGQMYSAVGSLCVDIYSNTIAMFFSKTILNSLDLASPYDLVRNHQWTMDKMLEMAAQSSSDLNGDGTLELANDQYGIYYNLQSGRALLPSFGWETSTKQDDGSYAYEFFNDSFVQLYHDVYNIIWNSEYVSYNSDAGEAFNAFKNNRLMFAADGIGVSAYLRDMESDFGIIPYPLYDENQEDYISYNYGTFYLAIPKSASNPEMSAVILEALNAESYNTVKDAYYEINMKEKFSRDADTQEMLDLIVDNIRFDFTFVNESATDRIVMYFFDQIAAKKDNISSQYEKKQKVFQKKLENLFETYAETVEE